MKLSNADNPKQADADSVLEDLRLNEYATVTQAKHAIYEAIVARFRDLPQAGIIGADGIRREYLELDDTIKVIKDYYGISDEE